MLLMEIFQGSHEDSSLENRGAGYFFGGKYFVDNSTSTCDYFIFFLSSEWAHQKTGLLFEMRSVPPNENSVVKSISRKYARKILSGESSYFHMDFVSRRADLSCRDFLNEVRMNGGRKAGEIYGNFLKLLIKAQKNYSKELSLIYMAYEEMCRDDYSSCFIKSKNGSLIDFASKNLLKGHANESLRDDWDVWLNSFFEGNDGEIYFFFFSIMFPVSFIGEVAFRLGSETMDGRDELFAEIEFLINSISGITVKKEKINEIHNFLANARGSASVR